MWSSKNKCVHLCHYKNHPCFNNLFLLLPLLQESRLQYKLINNKIKDILIIIIQSVRNRRASQTIDYIKKRTEIHEEIQILCLHNTVLPHARNHFQNVERLDKKERNLVLSVLADSFDFELYNRIR